MQKDVDFAKIGRQSSSRMTLSESSVRQAKSRWNVGTSFSQSETGLDGVMP